MLRHGRAGSHAVEEFELLAVLLDRLAAALVVTGEHATGHNEIGASAECLSYIAGTRAASVLCVC